MKRRSTHSQIKKLFEYLDTSEPRTVTDALGCRSVIRGSPDTLYPQSRRAVSHSLLHRLSPSSLTVTELPVREWTYIRSGARKGVKGTEAGVGMRRYTKPLSFATASLSPRSQPRLNAKLTSRKPSPAQLFSVRASKRVPPPSPSSPSSPCKAPPSFSH